MLVSLVLMLTAITGTAISHVLLKTGSRPDAPGCRFLPARLNYRVLAAYAIFILVTVISVIAMREIPLKIFNAAAYSLSFLLVTALSWAVLKEQISGRTLAGMGLIIAGLAIFHL